MFTRGHLAQAFQERRGASGAAGLELLFTAAIPVLLWPLLLRGRLATIPRAELRLLRGLALSSTLLRAETYRSAQNKGRERESNTELEIAVQVARLQFALWRAGQF